MSPSRRPTPGTPSVAKAILGALLPREDRRFALADLEEEFEERAGLDGLASARRWYRRQVMRSAWPTLRSRVTRLLPRFTAIHEDGPHAAAPDNGMGGGLGVMVHNVVSDLLFGLRSLRRTPVAVAVTILSLGIGIGAVTAAFAVANSFLLRPPVGLASPERLVTLYTSEDDGEPYGVSSYPDYRDMLRDLEAMGDAAAIAARSVSLGRGEEIQPVFGEEVSGNYFTVTGIRPVLGRTFLPEEGEAGAPRRVVVLGHDLWVRRFGSDPGVLGSAVRLNGLDFTVVGVAPDGVTSRRVPLEAELWVPVGSIDKAEGARVAELQDRGVRRFLIFARLQDGATLEQLQAQAAVFTDRLAQEYPDSWWDNRDEARTLTAVAEKDSRVRPGLRGLLGGIGVFFVATTGLILLIACSNVTSLFLARASSRSREMAVRASLGARRGRLVAMLMTEALIPGLAAGVVGVLVAAWTVGIINNASLPMNLPVHLSIDLDRRVLAFVVLTAVGASLVFGLIPALEGSRPSLVPALKGEGGVRARGRLNPRNVLVVVQCAASLVLLVGATLFVRALGSATDMKLGVDPERVAVATKTLDADEYGPEQGLQYLRELREEIASRPGVEDVQLSRSLELTLLLFSAGVELTVDGENPGADGNDSYMRNSVTPGYLDMLGIRMLRGRSLDESDAPGAPLVAVVNKTMAERFWPGEEALGKRFEVTDPLASAHGGIPGARTFEVVGVASDGKYGDFDDAPTPYFWTSLYQDYSSTVAVLAKGVESAEAMVPLLREAIELDNGEVQMLPPSTFASQLSLQFIHLRIASKVLTWGGAFGLFLAVIGIYGIVSFAVTQRTREMAVRIAIGAERLQVVRTIVRDGMRLALLGLALGLVVALPSARLLQSVLAGISPLDPLAFGGGLALLLAAALVASLIPARRATRIDPMKTLREE